MKGYISFERAMKRNVEQYGMDETDSAEAIVEDLLHQIKFLTAENKKLRKLLRKINEWTTSAKEADDKR